MVPNSAHLFTLQRARADGAGLVSQKLVMSLPQSVTSVCFVTLFREAFLPFPQSALWSLSCLIAHLGTFSAAERGI